MSMVDPLPPGPDAPRVGVIAGATATGKSALAVAVAEALDGVIVNADASQLYADVPILSAQPGEAERARVPHRLYGVLDGAEAGSAASWAAAARCEIDAAHGAGKLPLLVGGNGLYLRALLDGIAYVPEIDESVRAEVRALPTGAALAMLRDADPPAAARLAAGDRQRILRALEVVRGTGVPLAAWQAATTGGLTATHHIVAVVIERDRADIQTRCAVRIDAMFAGGAPEEAARLLARGLAADRPVLRTIGVPQLTAALAGRISYAAARDATLLATRQYAKRQSTWWRNQRPDWRRFDANHDPNSATLAACLAG